MSANRDAFADYFAEKLKKHQHLKDQEGKDPSLWQLTEELRVAYFKALKPQELRARDEDQGIRAVKKGK